MASFDATLVPRCTIDLPLDISPDEIVSLSGPVNTLLKSSYLLGGTFEIDAIFNSLFDIAEEIAGVQGKRSGDMGGSPRSTHRGLSFPGSPSVPDRSRGDRRALRQSRLDGPGVGGMVSSDLRGMVFQFPGVVPHAP
jgi:hypothetical protein